MKISFVTGALAGAVLVTAGSASLATICTRLLIRPRFSAPKH